MEIQDKIAIVTGAARGIGRATAEALAEAGARAVVLADVKRDLTEETATRVRDLGSEPFACEVDVSKPESLQDLFRETMDRFGGLHILHNNAGIHEGTSTWPDVPVERIAAIVDVNLRAVILGTHLAADAIQRSGGGAIVQTASGAAFTPLPPQAVYAATKAGVVHFTRSCVGMKASHGIRVSCVCPGLVETPLVAETGRDGPAPWLQSVLDGVNLLSPSDVAAKVLELIRDPESAGKVVSVENTGRS